MTRHRDLTGQRFGRLTALYLTEPDGERTRWACKCDCGIRHVVHANSLVQNYTRSCGCLRRETAAATAKARKARRMGATP